MRVRVELQFIEDCPNHTKMRDNLSVAIRGIEDKVHLVQTVVEDQEAAERLKFRGSPTLLINGDDVEGVPLPGKGSRSCRLYRHGIPSTQVIRQQIEAAFAKD